MPRQTPYEGKEVRYAPLPDSSPISPERTPCTVPGCYGKVHYETDGSGRLVSWCLECERRVVTVRAMGRKFSPGATLETAEQRLVTAEGRMVRAESSIELLAEKLAATRSALASVIEEQDNSRHIGELPTVGPTRAILLSLPTTPEKAITAKEVTTLSAVDNAELVRVLLHRLWKRHEINRTDFVRSSPVDVPRYWRDAA